MAAGSFFPLLALFLPRGTLLPLVMVAMGLGLALELARIRLPVFNQAIGRLIAVKERESRALSGAGYLLLSTLLAFLLFPQPVAAAGLLFTALADPVASLIGEKWGHHKVRHKSLEGSGAFLATCLLCGFLLRLAGSPLPALGLIAGALVATIVEMLPLPIDDNLTVPLAGGGTIALLLLWPGAS